jgi:hypothetical protein
MKPNLPKVDIPLQKQLMQEYGSIEVMNNRETQIPRDLKCERLIQII